MLRLEVVAYDGKPPTVPLSAEFDALGGTIGRDGACTLVLPDPEKRISRRHGVVARISGHYVLRDHGSALAIRHNGRNVGSGREVLLAAGDQIDIGGYTLRVSYPCGKAAEPAQAPASASPTTERSDLPLQGGLREPCRDPFADPAPLRNVAHPSFSAQASSAGVLPVDFDPFALPKAAPAVIPPVGATVRDPLGLGIVPPPPGEGLDALFSLHAGDLFPPGHPLAPPPTDGVSPSVDKLLGTPSRPSVAAPVQRDDVAELHGTMRLPEPVRGERVDAVTRSASDDGHYTLAVAFAQGAGMPELALHEITPERMRALGELLRVALEGTLELLRARASAKEEIRAGMTVIAPADNNPLKFSPTVETALAHLLAPQGHGFMVPRRALEEAYQDLVSHQFGLAAGMRAALEAVLARFDPAALEARLAEERSLLDPLVPSLRRARLWDLYAARFAELSGEAEQGFERAFARELVAAYEAEIARLVRR